MMSLLAWCTFIAQRLGTDLLIIIAIPYKDESSNQHKWILTAVDYFTKWVETIPVKQASDTIVTDFLDNNILSRFGCPRKLVTDNAKVFTSSKIVKFCNDYNIILSHSTTYYPQGNGLA